MMKLFRMYLACVAIAATLALPGAVLADDDDDDGPVAAVPEIDPGVLRGGLTVLAGGLLVLFDRRRRR